MAGVGGDDGVRRSYVGAHGTFAQSPAELRIGASRAVPASTDWDDGGSSSSSSGAEYDDDAAGSSAPISSTPAWLANFASSSISHAALPSSPFSIGREGAP